MNRKLFALSVGLAALLCAALTSAQQSDSATSNSFLKAYGARPSAPPAVVTQEQAPPNAQPQQTAPEPYVPLSEKSIWERLKVPPRDIPQETPPQTETTNQGQNVQPSTEQTQTQDQTQKTPDHYNIFQ